MIPMLLKVKIPGKREKPFNVYVPLLIVWLLLITLLILLLPLLLLLAIFTWAKGSGRLVLLFFPLLFSILWNLQGLKIDIKDEKSEIYLSFI
jgi:hypothetical protein